MDPRKVVRDGYDRLAERYLEWMGHIRDDPRYRFTAELAARLPDCAAVVDLGCGAGTPTTAALAERFDVLGVDISARQIDLARDTVPAARFVRSDMTTLELPAASLDAVTAYYSIAHTPRAGHADLFGRIADWLRPGGYLLAALGCGGDDGVYEWLGEPMFFSSHPPKTNRALLERAGFGLEVDEVVTMREPEGDVAFQWVIACRVTEPTGAADAIPTARAGTASSDEPDRRVTRPVRALRAVPESPGRTPAGHRVPGW